MTRTVLTAALAIVATSGCIDFGYRVPEPPAAIDAAGSDGPGDDGAGCVEGVATPADTGPQVHLITLAVDQRTLAISAGEVVTWTNTDTMVHTVTAGVPGAPQPPSQGGFNSGDLAPGARWAYRFCTARTAIYFCATHPGQMNNFRIVVGP